MLNNNAKKLVAALRSGDYKQGHFALLDIAGYCCLGVACDVYRTETGDGRWTDTGFFVVDGRLGNTQLPKKVMEWFGFRAGNPTTDDDVSLIELNDKEMKDFNEIADFIENNPSLFVK